jgi:hypothetical protein
MSVQGELRGVRFGVAIRQPSGIISHLEPRAMWKNPTKDRPYREMSTAKLMKGVLVEELGT